ncbi:MAG TPA: TIGR03936 family radical SAM-associated protein [Coriobacteriia bacterium]|nr:TIGR03936 family radical SAM-associated protein [Coriobacteriia bacterium]
MTPGEFRLRVTWVKAGRLRWLSHLEVLHALERVIRRSKLEYAVTHGFSPHMKIAFGPALPVGTAGQTEYADVWLTRYTGADEALEALRKAAPADLEPIGAQYVGDRVPSLTAALTIALYRVELVGGELGEDHVRRVVLELMRRGELHIEQKGKTKAFDLAVCIPKDPSVSVEEGSVVVELPVRMGPHGSLRPEVFIRAALAASGAEVSAIRTTRTDLLIESEDGSWQRPV